VAYAPEAIALREAGIDTPLLALEHSFATDGPALVAHDIAATVHSRALADALSGAAVEAGRVARVHIKVDTGLRRFGAMPAEAVALAEYCRGLPGIAVEGLFTHMANADEPDDSFSEVQQGRFAEVAAALDWIPYRHAANSATALRRDALRFNGVRIGLAMHGLPPPNTPDPGLQPTLSLKARVARVVDVAAGEGVAYGLTWRAERTSRLALVPVGYADGWRRSLGNRGEVLIAGRRCRMVGRVMMDQFLVDITSLETRVNEGDEVVLLGGEASAKITADEVAAWEGTISWEVLAALTARLPRLYVRGGMVLAGGS
jgi:alanine racemase